MHVAGCIGVRRAQPPLRRARRGRSCRGCTSSPATASGWRSCRSARAARCGSTTPFQRRASTSATRRCPARAATSSSSGSPAACSRRRSTAAGRCGSCGSSRVSRAVASRCCPRPTTRSSTGSPGSTSRPSCSTPRPTRCRWRRPTTSGSPRPLPTGAQLLADALLERATVPAEIVRGVRATLRGPRTRGQTRRPRARRRRRARLGRAAGRPAEPAQRPDRPPPPLHLGTADLEQFKAVKNALGGTVNDVVLAVVAGALGSYMRLHGESTEASVLQGDGAGLGPRRRRARRARQPGRGDVGAAAGG